MSPSRCRKRSRSPNRSAGFNRLIHPLQRSAKKDCPTYCPRARVADHMRNESRFRVIERTDSARFKRFLKQATEDAHKRYSVYQQLAGITFPKPRRRTKISSRRRRRNRRVPWI